MEYSVGCAVTGNCHRYRHSQRRNTCQSELEGIAETGREKLDGTRN